jgi:hypothetical protein
VVLRDRAVVVRDGRGWFGWYGLREAGMDREAEEGLYNAAAEHKTKWTIIGYM